MIILIVCTYYIIPVIHDNLSDIEGKSHVIIIFLSKNCLENKQGSSEIAIQGLNSILFTFYSYNFS